jgi:hypothetical protein
MIFLYLSEMRKTEFLQKASNKPLTLEMNDEKNFYVPCMPDHYCPSHRQDLTCLDLLSNLA